MRFCCSVLVVLALVCFVLVHLAAEGEGGSCAGEPGKLMLASSFDSSKVLVPRNSVASSLELPAAFTWRPDGTTPAKEQGICGCCWIFGGMGNLESKVKLAGYGEYDYSEQEVLDCAPFEPDCMSSGTRWGFFNHVYQSCTVLETDYPFEDAVGSCRGAGKARYMRATEMRILPDDSPGEARDLIKQTMMDHGPITSMIYGDFLPFIGIGYNGQSYGMFYDEYGAPTHTILVVGWDDAKPYYDEYPPDLGDPAGYGCWMLKNSYGTAWGDSGFGWVGYGSASMGTFNYYISSILPCDEDYGEILRYDEGFDGDFSGFTGYYSVYYAAKFETGSSDPISGVGVWLPVTEPVYNISIYDDATPSSNTWTTQLANLSGSLSLGGYHMLSVRPRVPVPTDGDFWVRCQITDPNSVCAGLIAYDDTAPTELGRCYVSHNGSSWTDASTWLGGVDVGIHARLGGPDPTSVESWDSYR